MWRIPQTANLVKIARCFLGTVKNKKTGSRIYSQLCRQAGRVGQICIPTYTASATAHKFCDVSSRHLPASSSYATGNKVTNSRRLSPTHFAPPTQRRDKNSTFQSRFVLSAVWMRHYVWRKPPRHLGARRSVHVLFIALWQTIHIIPSFVSPTVRLYNGTLDKFVKIEKT